MSGGTGFTHGLRERAAAWTGRLRRRAPRTFAAVLWPGGIDMIEYRTDREATTVLRHSRRLVPMPTPADAAEQLADLVEAEGGRGGRLALAVRDFGVVHRILTLPLADRELVRPIVERELQRFAPELGAAACDFVRIRTVDDEAAPRQELLAAAVPAGLVEALRSALSARAIALDHLTIVPRVAQRLYGTLIDGAEPAVVALLLPGAPLVTGFDRGELRLVREPPMAASTTPEHALGVAAELVDRAILFLRQQFGGGAVQRLFVAADEAGREELRAELAGRTGIEAVPIGDAAASAGVLAALGTAIDAVESEGLNLLPREMRGPARGRRSNRRAVAAGLAAVVGLVWIWALAGVEAERRARREVERTRVEIEDRLVPLSRIRPTVEERRSHAQRLRLLAEARTGTREARFILTAIAEAVPPTVEVDTLHVDRLPQGDWQVRMSGRVSDAGSTVYAYNALNWLSRGIDQRLAVRGDVATRFERSAQPVSQKSIAIRFDMSFIVGSED